MVNKQFPHKIIWLASYPKSGNTWFRAFVSALMGASEVELNNLKADGIFSSRQLFENITDISSHDLYDDEVKLMLPDVYRELAATRHSAALIKVHDAFTRNIAGEFIIPQDVTHCAVYFVRNPLDIIASFANHNNLTIDQTIKTLNNNDAYLAMQKANLNINVQTAQLLLNWSNHVISWTTLPNFPVYVLRYEDMLTDTFNVFKNVLNKIGWHYPDEEIKNAIAASSFKKLSEQEKSSGFFEKNINSKVFFRSGQAGNWVNELTPEQIARVTEQHGEVMKMYNYLP
ncbi:sulfotransferase domain-containing protein [Mucilaginibacter sp. Bleaf8]|uniref:sulfotransferase domain-containing protein n=1 Tax=Mucilaginibacter sp. Bleaf8 TaxID=2834430 RepID=UPI001BCF0FCF|nr:sulfotransferase domain-containing protein [Mucilaginibacter sp. Bleaf8]MBS7563854.1 sulfotransferase domain-containing protein [Mucilaginibacter sp. Bleaf8]